MNFTITYLFFQELSADMNYTNYMGLQNDQAIVPNMREHQLSHQMREHEQYYSGNVSPGGGTQNPLQYNYLNQSNLQYGQQSSSPYGHQGTPPYGQLTAEQTFQNMYEMGYGGNVYSAEMDYSAEGHDNLDSRRYAGRINDEVAIEKTRSEFVGESI